MSLSREQSYGVIPIRRFADGQLYILMVQHQKGHWGFPKGHPIDGESPQATADRELKEETGLQIESWIDDSSFTESYQFTRSDFAVVKRVTYFPAWVSGFIHLQREELLDSCWLLPDQLVLRSTFPEMKRLSQSVRSWCRSLLE